MTEKKKLILTPELVPGPLWGRSAYRMLGRRAKWTKEIRPDALKKANNRCEVCGSNSERLICHDKWQYDDKRLIATLIGFEIHCSKCDLVTHIGHSANFVSESADEILLSALNHLCKVNNCAPEAAQTAILDAFKKWEKRSKKSWVVQVAPKLIEQYPELAALPEFEPTPSS